jgi:cystathionine beta-lyase/cystathionine gamma-synthase
VTVRTELGTGTACVHAARGPLAPGAPLVAPLVQSTTYAWSDLDHAPPITYARGGNPTVEQLERALAGLEGGAAAVCFGSGLAAIDGLLRGLPDGSRVVVGRHLYGGTTRLLQRFHAQRLSVVEADSSDPESLQRAFERPTALALLESPSNPTLRISDLRSAARWAHASGALLAVDNTLLTPLYQRPLDLGADLVVHSTTKYLEGHNATLGGAVVLGRALAGEGDRPDGPWESRLRFTRKATGAVLASFEAWLTLRGLSTLHLRTRAQWSSAARVAESARHHASVVRVHYPGLVEHPGHRLHRGQASGDGGLVGIELETRASARAFLSGLRRFTLAENLGAVESLATHPASMTHVDLAPDRRRADGIPEGLVRLSVGVEDPEDLLADVLGALDRTVPAAVTTP